MSDRAGGARRIFVVMAVCVMSQPLVQASAVPALPEIQRELDTSQATASWVLTAFLVSAAVATPVGGRIGDAFGKTKVFAASLGLLAPGSVLAALAPTIELLIAERAVQGLGGGVVPLAFGVVRDHLPSEKVADAVAVISAMLSVGFVTGIVVAGPVVDHLGYRWLFVLPAIAAAVGICAVVLLVPESPMRDGGRVPILPAVLLAGWLVPFLVAVTRGPQAGWLSLTVVGLVVMAVVTAAIWLAVERRAANPLVDLALMRERGVWSANVVSLLVGVALYGSFALIPQFLQTPSVNGYGFDASVTEASWMMVPSSVVSFLCGLVAARIAVLLGVRQTLVQSSVVTAAAMLGLALWHDEVWMVVLWTCLSGLGSGVVFANLANAIVRAVRLEQTGAAIGMNANLRIIGGAIGAAATATIVASHVQPSGYPDEQGYVASFVFLAVGCLLAASAALLVPRRRVGAGVEATADTVPSGDGTAQLR